MILIIACGENEKQKQLELKVEKMSKELDSLKTSFAWHNMIQGYKDIAEIPKKVEFTFDSEGYQALKSNLGLILFISIDKIENYLDGIKIRFNIGNPYFVDFSGGEFSLTWGEKTKYHQFTKEIKRGS